MRCPSALTSLPIARGPLVATLALCCCCCAPVFRAYAADEPRNDGIDVLQTVDEIKKAISGPRSPVAKGKPWEDDIARLTDPRPELHGPAMAALIRRGSVVLDDLVVLASDPDWQIRGRVAQTAAGIGGDAGTALVLAISMDSEKAVRVLCAAGLGMAGGKGAFTRLVQLLASGDPIIREAAARALATLGDARGLGVLCTFARENDDVVQREMRTALGQLALRVTSIPTLCELLGQRQADDLAALIDASFLIGDPRLCPPLADLLKGADERAALYAARSLSANGDSRALGALCQIAASSPQPELRTTAAETLRQLTGYGAAAGPAWSLWWHEHQPAVEALYARDALIATLHDPLHVVTRAELSAFTTEQLSAVVDGAVDTGSGWWPARAYMVLKTDACERWTKPLLDRIAATTDPNRRLALIIILDQLGDAQAAEGLKQLLDGDRKLGPARKISDGPERLALTIALQRRGIANP